MKILQKILQEIKKDKRTYIELLFFCRCILTTLLLFYASPGIMEPVRMAIVALLLFLGCRRLKKHREQFKEKRKIAGIAILSISFAAMTVIGWKISITEYSMQQITSTDLIWVLLYACAYMVLFSNVLILVESRIIDTRFLTEVGESRSTFRWTWGCYTCLLAAFWMPVFFIYFPGILPADCTTSIAMFLEQMPWNNHFPVFYSFIIGGFVKLGMLFGKANIGLALYSAIQLGIMSLGLGYFCAWLAKRGLRKIWLYSILAFFASAPLFGNYAIVMWKDPVFSLLLLVLVLFLYDHVVCSKEDFLKPQKGMQYTLLTLGICLLRNNGIYIMVLVSLVLIIRYRKQWKKTILSCTLGIFIVLIITGPVYWKVFSAKNVFVESVGIPLQQMVRVVVNGGEMTDEQREYMDNLLPINQYPSVYNPFIVDPVKWSPDFDNHFLEENKGQFFQTWWGMLGPNFPTYVESYLMGTLSFWRIGEELPYELAKTTVMNNEWGLFAYQPVELLTGYQVIEQLNTKYGFIPVAIPIWLTFINIILCFIRKKGKYVIPLLPLVGVWLTMMVATPTAFGVRYVFMFVLALPLLLVYPWIVKRCSGKIESAE